MKVWMLRYRTVKLPTLLMVVFLVFYSPVAFGFDSDMDPADRLARPSPQQVAWHEMEIEMFLCLDPATWQNREYDNHSTPLSKINPFKLDTDQWCRVAKSFGAKQIVFVGKHSGGFCWWQSDTADYSIKSTSWKQGKGDVLAELAESCKHHGLKLGIYVYPGDDTYGAPMGSGGKTRDPAMQPIYNEVFRRQMTEVLSHYTTIDEVWFDGSCVIEVGDILKKFAPSAMIFQGPHATIRWVGNEKGVGPDPCWNAVKKADADTGVATAIHGDPDGDVWLPNEVDTTFVDHKWFWAENIDRKLKSLSRLMEIYYLSVGRGCVLLLNATPDTTGLIPDTHVQRYAEFGAEIKKRFGQSIAETQGQGRLIALNFDRPTTVNHTITQEDIAQGQRIRAYTIEGLIDNQWQHLFSGTSIGYKKIDFFDSVAVSALRLHTTESVGDPQIKRFAAFNVISPVPFPEQSKSVSVAKPNKQLIGQWDDTAIKTEWTPLDIDLSPFIPQAGQYLLRFEDTTGTENFEIQSVVALLEGLPAPDFAKPYKTPNTYIINRTAVISEDKQESTRLRVVIRRTSSDFCTIKAVIKPLLPDTKGDTRIANPDEADESFSIVVMPDTQIYPQDQPGWRRSSRKEVFIQQAKWIADNVQKLNIKFVLHMGDIVNEQDKPYQWTNANEAMSILDGAVPYCFVIGNHDMVLDETRDTTNFNNTFPYTRYEKQPWYGGRLADDGYPPGDNYDNCYHFFDAGNAHYMVVSLECGPTDAMLQWADGVIVSHADKKVIVMTHSYMVGDDRRDESTYYIPPSPPANTGEHIWNKLIRKHANIFLVLCGHRENSPTHKGLLTSTGDHGNTVYQLLSGEWYDGWLRILTFEPSQNKIFVKTYSPWKPQNPDQQLKQYDTPLPGYNTDPCHQYELTFNQ